jgi:hypothetical protein
MTVNMTYELKNIQKKMSQRGNHERAHWDTREKLQEIVKQNIEDELKEYQILQIKKLEKTQKQLNECREGVKKLQSERRLLKRRYMK